MRIATASPQNQSKKASFAFSLMILLCASLAHGQTVVFEADFDGATAVAGSVTANATASNLNAGTAVGSWTAVGSPSGAVISDGGAQKAFVFDKATSGSSENSVKANLSQAVDLAGNTLTLEMDLYAVRQAGNQIVHFSLDDAAGNEAYAFSFQMNNNKRFFATSASGTISSTNATGINNGFKNPAVNGYLSWSTASMVHVKLEATGSPSAPGAHVAELSIDWNGDGDYDDDSEWVAVDIAPESDQASVIRSLRISNESSRNGGAWIDNLEVTSAPGSISTAPEIFNLAKFQKTSSDSAEGTWPKQYATDGLVTQDSRWVSKSGGPHWLEVELAVPMRVGSAHLYSGGTFNSVMSNSVVQYFSRNSWVDISGTARSGNSKIVQNLAFDRAVTAQRFRVYSTDNIGRIIEFALYPPTADGSDVPFGTDVDLNFAKLRQYDFSSVSGEHYPKLAIDGYVDDSSAWASADAAGPHDLEIHLPYAEEIGGVHLYSGFEGQNGTQMKNFQIAYQSNGSWVVFNGGEVTGNTELNRSIEFATAVKTTKVRLRSLDSSQAVVRELVVLPKADPWFPLGTDAKDQAPPQASFMDYEDSYYSIENQAEGTNLVSSQSGSSLTSEEPLFQVLLNLGGDDYRLRSVESGECFEVSLASTAEGAAVVEGTYSHMPHQRWKLEPIAGSSFVRIKNLWSGLVLAFDGTAVVQEEADGAASQNWKINYETHFPKKGQNSFFHFSHLFNPNWGYAWNFNAAQELKSGQYTPMQWGKMAAASPGILKFQPEWYGSANQVTMMGFNEPDLSDQSNIDVDTAIYQWPRLERMRLPLLGPAPANRAGAWRVGFETAAEEQGLRSEYMGEHWYSTSGASTGSPTGLINAMKSLYDTYGKPIWLTEFSTRDFVGDKTTWSRADNYNFLAEFMWRAESLDWLKRYSVFEWSLFGGDPATTDASSEDPYAMNSPRLALHIRNDKDDPGFEDLSESGLLLAGWDGDATVRDEKAYIIHNKGRQLRLIDDPSLSSVTSADLLHRSATEQFMLEAAPGGRKYIVGLSDGRRLSYNGSNVGLASAETTGAAVEWSLKQYQYGWFYLEHPGENKRLNMFANGGFSMAGINTANDNVRFRFITPAQPISPTEVQTLPYAESFENGMGAWRQFEADVYDWEVHSGGTPTGSAGPSGASDGQFYLFAEGHESLVVDEETQVTCDFDLNSVSTAKLTFDYHMHGSFIKFLTVDINDGSGWDLDVWKKSGQQQTSSTAPWAQAEVDLAPYLGSDQVTIRFRTQRGQFGGADPAIDNIVVKEDARTLPYVETFESGFGSWYQVKNDDIDWTRHSGGTESPAAGPSGASEGNWYVYFEGHDSSVKDKSASLACAFDLSTETSAQLTFDYHMYGAFIESLVVDVHDGSSWSTVWEADGQQHGSSTVPWSTATVDLTSFVGNDEVVIRFTNTEKTWFSSDTALDWIRVEEAPEVSPYQLWAQSAFAGAGAGVDTSTSGNPDGDAYTNAEEWALVLDPMTADVPSLFVSNNGTHLAVDYSRRTGEGMEVRAAWSTTLESDDWHYLGEGGLTETLLETVDGVESMSASVPMGDGPKKFLRIEVWDAAE